MKNYYKITPEGTHDLMFEDCAARKKVDNIVERIFMLKGYNQVITPGLEFFDAFNRGSSGIQQEDMYILTDRKGRLMVMRPDLTLPIARMASTRLQNEILPLRFFYNQTVYRNLPALTGRSNEVRQAGIELLGAGGKRADLEVITTAVDVLSGTVGDFRIELGHAGFFRCLADRLNVSDIVKEEIRICIESKNYSALGTILDSLEQTDTVDIIKKLPRLFGGEEIFEKVLSLPIGKEAESCILYVKELYNDLKKYVDGSKLMIDLGLVQRNDYYSDIVFSGYTPGSGEALLIGGRYDSLMDAFGRSMPAAGFGVNIDILSQFEKAELSPAQILVHAVPGFEIEAIKYESNLLSKGIKYENSVFKTEKDAYNYARESRIKKLVIVGSETIEKDV